MQKIGISVRANSSAYLCVLCGSRFLEYKGRISMKKDDKNSVLVWSSEVGRVCPGCGKAVIACICKKGTAKPVGDGIVRVRRESKGRGGKTVTVVSGAPGDDAALKALAGELKRRCGTGGTVKDGNIEIQGDFRDLLVDELAKRGFTVKRNS